MKKLIFIVLINFITAANAQDISTLLKEASNFELKFNETEALDKYKEVIVIEPSNYKALQNIIELSCSIGSREKKVNDKRLYYESALAYANRIFIIDSTNANTYYLLAMVSGKLTEVETENKKKVNLVKDIKEYADKSLAINPNHGLANFILGKWHFEMLDLSWFKK